jgi:hypothetical protein
MSDCPELGFEKRWIAYFDILGFKRKILSSKNPLQEYFLTEMYETVIGKLKQDEHYVDGLIFYTWFSDTFIMYSTDDSPQAYAWIISLARHFISRCIMAEIPLRGALSFGPLYVNRERNVILGQALVTAYEAAEKQDWIGLVLTPHVLDKIHEYDLAHPDRVNFIECDVPIKKSGGAEKMFACKFYMPTNGGNVLIRNLENMKVKIDETDEMEKSKIREKYTRTITHINKYHTRILIPKITSEAI